MINDGDAPRPLDARLRGDGGGEGARSSCSSCLTAAASLTAAAAASAVDSASAAIGPEAAKEAHHERSKLMLRVYALEHDEAYVAAKFAVAHAPARIR